MMLEKILFYFFIFIEVTFMILGLIKKSNLKREKSMTKIILLGVFILLVLTQLISWGFKWVGLLIVLMIQALIGIHFILKKKENTSIKKIKFVLKEINQIFIILFAFLPALIFPQYEPIMTTGEYSYGTVSYTLTDTSRDETFTEEKDDRNVTIQFWYPTNENGEINDNETYPLVIFSHGAFGYRMSNFSTYAELASNGYIVGSIDHTYHAFMTKEDDGDTIIANLEFINQAMGAQMGEISGEELYQLEQSWMDVRTKDLLFILDTIKEKVSSSNSEAVYKSIDIEHIGLMGHSLGGATAAQIGRGDESVDAVIVIDGTMLGEVIGFEDGKEIITDEIYQKPILNIYNESHYEEAKNNEQYPNTKVFNTGLDTYQVVFERAGHMNFTDLAIVSPFLSGLLESEKVSVDERTCIETTNEVILEFFDHYLKSHQGEIEKERYYR